jgi:hypothetical protein
MIERAGSSESSPRDPFGVASLVEAAPFFRSRVPARAGVAGRGEQLLVWAERILTAGSLEETFAD